MTTTQLVKKIHISLDSLIDIRLGTLIKLSPEFAYQISSSKEYYTRDEDLFSTEEFGQLSKETFLAIQESYKDEIIRGSVMTKLFPFIRELMTNLINQAVATPYYGEIEIEVNTYPYQFKDKEANLLVKAISHHLGGFYTVNLAHMSNEQLSIEYVENNLVALILYNPKAWLDLHNRKLQKGKCKDILLYTPMLNHIRSLTEEEIADLKEKGMNIFQVFMMLMSPFIRMQFLPIALFSADTIENKKEFSC